MSEFKKSIFKDQKFYLNGFVSIGASPSENELTEKEKQNSVQMRNISAIVINELGGAVCSEVKNANFIVIYQQFMEKAKADEIHKDQKLINFKYITECYFQMLRIRLDSKSETQFNSTFIIKLI